ncbi:MAG: creatininase family protein [Myxococcales bacterium]|nr:creatininase family protein [Myxococcales bacterium]
MKRIWALVGVVAIAAIAFGVQRAATAPGASVYQDAAPIAVADLPVQLEELTWTEVRALIAAGHRTVIIPTGGTEQNGPHMVLGKHNHVVRHTAGRIARELGQTLVAPVVAYVPEGDIDRRTSHMAFAGTISIPEDTFAGVLEATARSLAAHGFEHICFLGDSGGNQAAQARVAKRLNARWAGSRTRALHVGTYYDGNGQQAWLESQGESKETIGMHAGIRDTSELLAIHPEGVRAERARPGALPEMANAGVDGDPTRANAERGRALLQMKVDAAVRQIRGELGN